MAHVQVGSVADGIRYLAAYTDGRFHHIIVANALGDIRDIWYTTDPSDGGNDARANVRDIRGNANIDVAGLGAYYSQHDKFQHVIVASSDGNVEEFWLGGPVGSGNDSKRLPVAITSRP